jgi:hypothetical protein
VRPIRPSDDGPRSPRRWSRRPLAVVFGVLLAMLAGACNGSTAPEPGEHESKHEDATESLRQPSTALTPFGTVVAGPAAPAAR